MLLRSFSETELVVLQNARYLPEVKEPPASNADSLELKHTAGQDPKAEAKSLDKDLKRFQNQTMHRQMASKLADSYVKKGEHKSHMTALPAAHATVLGAARAHKLVMKPFQKGPIKAERRSLQLCPPPLSYLAVSSFSLPRKSSAIFTTITGCRIRKITPN